jgi:hypothetical protein
VKVVRICVLGLIGLLPAGSALAEGSSSAQETFDQAKARMVARKFRSAAEGFEEVLRQKPDAIGAWINLAVCQEHLNDLPAAWNAWSRAALHADAGKDERLAKAQKNANDLEYRLTLLELRSPPEQRQEGVRITVDSKPVALTAATSTVVAVMPGLHEVVFRFEDRDRAPKIHAFGGRAGERIQLEVPGATPKVKAPRDEPKPGEAEAKNRELSYREFVDTNEMVRSTPSLMAAIAASGLALSTRVREASVDRSSESACKTS